MFLPISHMHQILNYSMLDPGITCRSFQKSLRIIKSSRIVRRGWLKSKTRTDCIAHGITGGFRVEDRLKGGAVESTVGLYDLCRAHLSAMAEISGHLDLGSCPGLALIMDCSELVDDSAL